MTTLQLHDGATAVEIDPQVGAGIRSLSLAHSVVPIAAPFAVGNPSFAVSGWQTMFPNAGRASSFGGRDLPDHGAALQGTWAITEQTADVAWLGFSDDSLRIDRSVRVEAATGLTLRDRVTNIGNETTRFQYGHHLVVELELDAVLTIGGMSYTARQFLADAGGREALRSFPAAGAVGVAEGSSSFAIAWDPVIMPFLWVWVLERGERVVVGIEPVSSSRFLGLADAVETGEALRLAAFSSMETFVRVTTRSAP